MIEFEDSDPLLAAVDTRMFLEVATEAFAVLPSSAIDLLHRAANVCRSILLVVQMAILSVAFSAERLTSTRCSICIGVRLKRLELTAARARAEQDKLPLRLYHGAARGPRRAVQPNCLALLTRWQFAHRTSHFSISRRRIPGEAVLIILATAPVFSAGTV